MGSKKIYQTSYHKDYSQDLIERRNVTDAVSANLDFRGKIGLDAGCNGGFLALFLVKNGAKKVYGCDISPQFIKQCKKEAQIRGLTKKTDFKVADIQKLPYKNSQFDFIVCSEVLEHVPNPEKAVKEFYRILKTGGIIVATTPNIFNPAEILHNLKHYLMWLLKKEEITHIQHFTFGKIKKLFSVFKIKKIYGLGIGFAFLSYKTFKFIQRLDLAMGRIIRPLAFDILIMATK